MVLIFTNKVKSELKEMCEIKLLDSEFASNSNVGFALWMITRKYLVGSNVISLIKVDPLNLQYAYRRSVSEFFCYILLGEYDLVFVVLNTPINTSRKKNNLVNLESISYKPNVSIWSFFICKEYLKQERILLYTRLFSTLFHLRGKVQ